MELIQISDSYKETADSFLESSKLVSVLEKYGRIEFEGAYVCPGKLLFFFNSTTIGKWSDAFFVKLFFITR